jgi:quercetin dioxygenase-like cupin family protein
VQLFWVAAVPGHTQSKNAGEETVRRIDRFRGSAKLSPKSGGPKDASMSVRQVSVPGKQRVDVALDPGFHVVTLRAGEITAAIDGKEEKHNTGDIWTVKENSRMSVTASGEAAVLEVMTLVVR